VKTESLLAAAAADSHRSLTEDKRREINKIHDNQIEKIREIEKINLTSSKIDHLTKHDQIKIERIIHFLKAFIFISKNFIRVKILFI
jgi:hypothetical protein